MIRELNMGVCCSRWKRIYDIQSLLLHWHRLIHDYFDKSVTTLLQYSQVVNREINYCLSNGDKGHFWIIHVLWQLAGSFSLSMTTKEWCWIILCRIDPDAKWLPFWVSPIHFSYHSLAKRLLSFFAVTVLKFAISQSEVYCPAPDCPDISRYQVTDRPDIITVTLNFGLNL